MISICIDARMINNSGIGVYVQEYTEYLLSEQIFAVTLMGNKEALQKRFNAQNNWVLVENNTPIYSLKEQVSFLSCVPKCDVFWSPHYNIPLLPVKAKKRIVTIPDVFHLAHLDKLSLIQKIYAKIVTNAATRLSDKILTISSFSQKEIVRLTGVNPDRITTIYLGMDLEHFKCINDVSLQKEVRELYSLPERYILFVGNVKPNKNLRLLVEAFRQLASDVPDIHLLIAGKKNGFITGDPDLFDRIEKDSVLSERVFFSGYVENEHLPVLYNMATIFAFPSLYEGFGFPPLEAMACCCPVIASNAASIPEICGDAPLYIDPGDSTELANGIKRLLSDSVYRGQLIQNGLRRVKRYSWLESKRQFVNEIIKLAS